jgi:hypothetical protein
MTLQAMGVLTLTACFTIIDFDLDDGAGGAGTAGGPGVATSTGNAMGGQGGQGGQGGRGGAEPGCEPGCVSCVEDICQAEAVLSADTEIKILGAGGNNVAYIEAGPGAPITFVNAQTGGVVKTMNGEPNQPWDAVGSITLRPDGVAYYAPQAAQNDQPVQACDPAGTDCERAFTAPGNAHHFNGLTFFDGYVFGVGSESAVQAPRSVALRGDRVLATSLGSPGDGPPCLGIGDVDPLIAQNTGEPLTCYELASQYLQVSSPTIAADGSIFARVLAGGPSYTALTLKFDAAGNVSNNFPHVPLAASRRTRPTCISSETCWGSDSFGVTSTG